MDEEWRNVPGAEGYFVSSQGRLRNGAKEIVGYVSKSTGYRRTAIKIVGKRTDVLFHRLVAAAFIGPCPDGLEVNHIDGCKDNNAVCNLEYLTCTENMKHAWRTGLCPTGARHGRHTMPDKSARGERVNTAKLTASQVQHARSMRSNGFKLREIAATFGICVSQASNITTGLQWRHVK